MSSPARMLPSTSTFSMSNAALDKHGISSSGSLHNTTTTPTWPSHPEPASTPSCRLHPRSSQDARLNGDSLGPVNDGMPAAATSADDTAAPELEGQSRHEDGRLSTTVDQDMPGAPGPVILLGTTLWRIRTTTVLASFTSSLLLNNRLKTGARGYLRPTP